MTPHMVIETTAYVMAAMCGVFSGRCILKYKIGSVAFAFVCRAILRLLVIAIAILFLASVVESLVASSVYQAFSSNDETLPMLHPEHTEHDHLHD